MRRDQRQVDDSLENYAEVLVKRNLAGREASCGVSEQHNLFPADVSAEYAAARPHMVYSDEEIFIPEKDEEEPARVLRMIFRDREGSYKELTVMTPTIEKDDLQEAILWWIVYLYLFLLLTILLINILVLHRTLRPLYALLVARRLQGRRKERSAGQRYEDRRIPAAERGGDPQCRSGPKCCSTTRSSSSATVTEIQTPLAVAATGWRCSWATARR